MVELADADFAATGTEVSCATTRNHDPRGVGSAGAAFHAMGWRVLLRRRRSGRVAAADIGSLPAAGFIDPHHDGGGRNH